MRYFLPVCCSLQIRFLLIRCLRCKSPFRCEFGLELHLNKNYLQPLLRSTHFTEHVQTWLSVQKLVFLSVVLNMRTLAMDSLRSDLATTIEDSYLFSGSDVFLDLNTKFFMLYSSGVRTIWLRPRINKRCGTEH